MLIKTVKKNVMKNPRILNYIVVTIILILLVLIVCIDTPSDYPEGDFHALVISDTHISNDETKDKRLLQLIHQINENNFPQVKFLIVTGDVVSRIYSDYTDDNPDTSNSRLIKAVDLFNQLTIPYYLVMGNHDYKIGPDVDSDGYFAGEEILKIEKIWKRHTGLPPYYYFKYNGWHFIVLNSFRGRYLHRYFDEEQLDWFQNVMSADEPTVVFSHFPLKTDHYRIWCKSKDLISPELENRFFSILEEHKGQIKGIFVGHGHRWVRDRLGDTIPVYETDSFADSKTLPYYVIGFDGRKKIHVARSPLKISN